MRFAPIMPPTPRARVSVGKVTAADVATLLSQVLQNQAVIMNDLAQIKNALPFLAAAPFEAAQVTSPANSIALFGSFGPLNNRLTQILSS
jgi:hypothetical protein